MIKFIVEFDTGHAPMLHSTEVATALRKVADLVEPWEVLYAGGRIIKNEDSQPIGEWKVVV